MTVLHGDRVEDTGRRHYRIAMLASPCVATRGWNPVASAVTLLAEGLVSQGHDVTVFAGSQPKTARWTGARTQNIGSPHRPYPAQQWQYDTDHIARVFMAVDDAAQRCQPFDLVHDHCDFTAVALAQRLPIPLIHTLHGEVTAEMAALYAPYSHSAHLVATSEAQRASFPAALRTVDVIPDPIDLQGCAFQPQKENYLLWVGGFDDFRTAEQTAAAAAAAHVALLISAPMIRGQERHFASRIAPHLDDDQIQYVGEVSSRRQQQLIADARALLVPTRRESQRNRHLVLRSLASGTPVIAYRNSGLDEIVHDGSNGYLIEDETGLRQAISGVPLLKPVACRASLEGRFDVEHIVEQYERVYRLVVPDMVGSAK